MSDRPASRVQRLLPDYTDAQLEDALALTQELRDEAIADIRLIEAEMIDRRRKRDDEPPDLWRKTVGH